MTRKAKRRLYAIVIVLTGVVVAAALTLTALEDNITLFYSPSDIVSVTEPGHTSKVRLNLPPGDRPFRLGGIVVENSIDKQGTELRFTVTDTVADMDVMYDGIVPNLFAENQGVVALGRVNENGVFVATEILAKHDENYMPPEVARALEKNDSVKLPRKYKPYK